MAKKGKLFQKLLQSPRNTWFDDFMLILEAFGFVLARTRGSHRVFKHPDLPDAMLSIQPGKNGKAKPYQIRQFLKLVEEYNLQMEDDASGAAEEDTD